MILRIMFPGSVLMGPMIAGIVGIIARETILRL